MLNLDNDHPRVIRPGPFLVELVGAFLNDLVVALKVEAGTVLRLQVRIRRRFAETAEVRGEVTVKDDEWVMGLRMRIEALRQQHVGPQVHWPTPKLCEQLTLHFYMLDVFRVLWRFDWTDSLVKVELDGAAIVRRDRDSLRSTVKVSRRATPLLTFAAIHWQLDR